MFVIGHTCGSQSPVFVATCVASFSTVAVLVGGKCYLLVVLGCISLMTNNVGQFFVCLLAHRFSGVNVCTKSMPILKLGYSSLQDPFFMYGVHKSLVSHVSFTYFLSLCCVFLMMPFDTEKFKILMKCYLFIFCYLCFVRTIVQTEVTLTFVPMLSARSLIVSALTFRLGYLFSQF